VARSLPSTQAPHRRRARRLALPAVLLATAMLAAACGGDDSGSEDGKVTLRFTWWGSDSRHAYTQKLIDLYESKNPNVSIEPEYSGFADYWDKLATNVAGGNAPDVLQQDIKYVREYAGRQALLDLSPYLGSTIATTDLDKTVSEIGVVDGKTYGIPTGVNAFSIAANPAIFEAAKVALPDDKTWSWDDFLKTAAAITKGSPEETFGTQDIGYVDASLEIFARQRGESIYGDDGKLAITAPTLTAFWTMIAKSRDTKAEPPASVSVEVQAGGPDGSLIGTGKGAMGPWWTNEIPALTAASGAELKLLRFPGETQGTQPGMFLKPAMFWSIGAKAKHPEEAAKFVNFLLNDPEAAKLILSDRGAPINMKLREEIKPSLAPPDQVSADFLASIASSISPPPPLPPMGAGEVNTIIQQLNEQVLFNKITPAQAADQFLSQAATAIGG
jgi:multiple sugar transport system substrate-binding protein